MKTITNLFAAAAAAVVFAAPAVYAAPMADDAHVSTVPAIRAVLTENVKGSVSVHKNGSIKIEYKSGAPVFVSFRDANGDKISAGSDSATSIHTITFLCMVKRGGVGKEEYNKYLEAANKLNTNYALQAFVLPDDDGSCDLFMSRIEYVTPSYSVEQFLKIYRRFANLTGDVETGKIETGL